MQAVIKIAMQEVLASPVVAARIKNTMAAREVGRWVQFLNVSFQPMGDKSSQSL